MSILDKKFIADITNAPGVISNYTEYEQYLKHGVKNILQADALSHMFEGGGSDMTAFVLFRYEDKYILLDICMGTCSCCKSHLDTYNSIIERSLDQCYVSTNLEEVENYYLKRLKNVEMDTEIRKRDHLYYFYPEWPF